MKSASEKAGVAVLVVVAMVAGEEDLVERLRRRWCGAEEGCKSSQERGGTRRTAALPMYPTTIRRLLCDGRISMGDSLSCELGCNPITLCHVVDLQCYQADSGLISGCLSRSFPAFRCR